MSETVTNRIFKDPRSRNNDLKVLKALAYSRGLPKYDVAKKILNKDKLDIPNDQADVGTIGRRIEALCKTDYVRERKGQTTLRKEETEIFELTARGFYAILLCDKAAFTDWRTIAKNYPEYFGQKSFDKAIFEKGTDWVFWLVNLKAYRDLLVSGKISFDLDWERVEEEVSRKVEAWLAKISLLAKEGRPEPVRRAMHTFNLLASATKEDVESLISIFSIPEVCQEIANHFRSEKEKLMENIKLYEDVERLAPEMPRIFGKRSSNQR